MPKIIPGTYSISDFGRFVSEFTAVDSSGTELPVMELDENRWEISNASHLSRISYKVDDTFDGSKGKNIFEPGGTNIEAGKNFILNTFGVFGYLKGFENRAFNLIVTKPEGFYGSTSLERLSTGEESVDVFTAPDYFEFHDSPIMYCLPDTASIQVANARVEVSVYSPNNIISSSYVLEQVKDVLLATRDYLEDSLPVNRYSILIYLLDKMSNSGGFGALEHSYSTLFVLPETDPAYLASTLRDITAHEFLHIITPLNIHSEQIHDFNFIEPKMSRHLWLYEGCTEYTSHLVQVRAGLTSEEEFLNVIRQKMFNADNFNHDISFTQLSKGALDKYEDQYLNVYEKGALIGMCVDLKLLIHSNGKYGLKDLMKDLAMRYGKDEPFEDDRLFKEIADLTFPEMELFLETYVGGTESLPFESLLEEAGIIYKAQHYLEIPTAGNINLNINESTSRIVVTDENGLNAFGKKLGIKKGDELVSWNGLPADLENFGIAVENFRKTVRKGDKVEVEVMRPTKKGDFKLKKLKARAIMITENEIHYLTPNPSPSTDQSKIKKAWIGK